MCGQILKYFLASNCHWFKEWLAFKQFSDLLFSGVICLSIFHRLICRFVSFAFAWWFWRAIQSTLFLPALPSFIRAYHIFKHWCYFSLFMFITGTPHALGDSAKLYIIVLIYFEDSYIFMYILVLFQGFSRNHELFFDDSSWPFIVLSNLPCWMNVYWDYISLCVNI